MNSPRPGSTRPSTSYRVGALPLVERFHIAACPGFVDAHRKSIARLGRRAMPAMLIWMGVPILVIVVFALNNGIWSLLFSPTGALILSCCSAMIILPIGGWPAVFKLLMPDIIFMLIAAWMFEGLKSGYCATFGSNTYRCVEIKK